MDFVLLCSVHVVCYAVSVEYHVVGFFICLFFGLFLVGVGGVLLFFLFSPLLDGKNDKKELAWLLFTA